MKSRLHILHLLIFGSVCFVPIAEVSAGCPKTGSVADGKTLMAKAGSLEKNGKFEQAGETYRLAAAELTKEGRDSTLANRRSAVCFEKEADKLLSRVGSPVAGAAQPSRTRAQSGMHSGKQRTNPVPATRQPVSKVNSSGAPTESIVKALVSEIYAKKHFNGTVTTVAFQSVRMVRGAHTGKEYLDGDISLASTVYTYSVKFTVRTDYPSQYEIYSVDNNYAVYKFHGRWDKAGVAGGTGTGRVQTVNK